MTDHYSGFLVILEKDIRDDDAQPIIDAIKQLRGVLRVEPQTSDPMLEAIGADRERVRIHDELLKVIKVIWKAE